MSEHEISSLYDSSPESLLDLCLEYITINLNSYTEPDVCRGCWKFKDGIVLPAEVCERFLKVYQRKHRTNDFVASLFRNQYQTRLEEIRLRNSRMTLDGIRFMLEHKPTKIELMQCEFLSQAWLELISNNSENLVTLKFGPLKNLVSQKDKELIRQRCYVINAPKLRRLTIQCRGTGISPILLTRPLRYLTHLDLSDYTFSGTTWAIYELKNLRSLVLHSVMWSLEVVEWIAGLRMLRRLDISQANERLGKYANPNEVLAKIVASLPHLESLDISGTNLAGTGSALPALTEGGSQDWAEGAQVRCDIPGLVSRVNRPLEFLGLYGTHHGACKRHDIPAKIVIFFISFYCKKLFICLHMYMQAYKHIYVYVACICSHCQKSIISCRAKFLSLYMP